MNVQRCRAAILGIAAGVAIIAGIGILAGQGAQPQAKSTDTAQPRLAAAERVCSILHDQETGESLPHQGVEHTYLWSLRRMEAQRRVDSARGDSASALEAHLNRMRSLGDRVAKIQKSGGLSRFDAACVQYYIAEAEDLLAQAR